MTFEEEFTDSLVRIALPVDAFCVASQGQAGVSERVALAGFAEER